MVSTSSRFRAGLRASGFVIAGLAFVALYVSVLWRAPSFLVNQDLLRDPGLRPEHRLSAEHNARLIVISIGGALVVLAGLLYTARNYRLAHRGQVTERFTKALERLGSDEMYVRIGGVLALEHVMRDSPEHHSDVVVVLVAFVRDRAPRRSEGSVACDPDPETSADEDDAPSLPFEPAADVQAALTALGRRPDRVRLEHGPLALHDLHLQGADLRAARLERANLRGAQLRHADLVGARLMGANLEGAYLQQANLRGAQLQTASLRDAYLERVTLIAANLHSADLGSAGLQEARMWKAKLEGADLRYARLRGADLEDAQLQGADLRGTQLQDAKLDGTQLQGADLERAEVTAEQINRATTDKRTKLPR